MHHPTIYFAHPMSHYGMAVEKRAIRAIRNKWPRADVVNPSNLSDEYDRDPQRYSDPMAFWRKQVRQADFLVYTTLGSGAITAGVYTEIVEAYLHGKPIYQWHPGSAYLSASKPGLTFVLPIDETRTRIRAGEV